MKRLFLLLTILFSAVVYFYFIRSTSEHSNMSNINWTDVNLKELPLPVNKLDNAALQEIKMTQQTITLQGYEVFYRKASSKNSNGINVLFLHGMRFKSETWLKLKTIHYLAALDYDVTAIDFPGFGESSKEQVPESDRANFLHELITSLNLSPCVIISPSLSGSFTVPLLKSHPEDFLAYVPIAPIRTDSLTPEQYKAIRIPTLILYGEKDEVLGHESVSNLKHIPTSQVFMIPKAGHAAYLDDPDLFHQVLHNFLVFVSKSKDK